MMLNKSDLHISKEEALCRKKKQQVIYERDIIKWAR